MAASAFSHVCRQESNGKGEKEMSQVGLSGQRREKERQTERQRDRDRQRESYRQSKVDGEKTVRMSLVISFGFTCSRQSLLVLHWLFCVQGAKGPTQSPPLPLNHVQAGHCRLFRRPLDRWGNSRRYSRWACGWRGSISRAFMLACFCCMYLGLSGLHAYHLVSSSFWLASMTGRFADCPSVCR